jgi:hypothetical protein
VPEEIFADIVITLLVSLWLSFRLESGVPWVRDL